jgi:hypothetical protein
MKENKTLAAVARVCLVALLQAACGGGAGGPAAPSQGTPSPAPTPPSLGSVDSALVGTWTGTVCCIFGPAEMTMSLNADSTAQFEGTGRYCLVVGNWGVSGVEFSARGGDCTGTVVTLVAPVSSTRLDGQVTTSGGSTGTFSLIKQ